METALLLVLLLVLVGLVLLSNNTPSTSNKDGADQILEANTCVAIALARIEDKRPKTTLLFLPQELRDAVSRQVAKLHEQCD